MPFILLNNSELGSYSMAAQAASGLLGSRNAPASASQVAGLPVYVTVPSCPGLVLGAMDQAFM